METVLKLSDLTKLPLEIKNEGDINPSLIWQPFELVKDSGDWYLPFDAKDDLIKNNINFEEVEIQL